MKGSAVEAQLVLLVFQEKKIDTTKKKILKNKKGSAAEAQLVLACCSFSTTEASKKRMVWGKKAHKLSSE